MKTAFTLFFICVLFCPLFAQKKDEGLSLIAKAETHIASLNGKTSFYKGKLPFSKVVVYDYRFDSTKIGYINGNSFGRKNYRIKMKSTWNDYLGRYMVKNLDENSGYTLAIVIRSFWMQEGYLEYTSDNKIKPLTYRDGGTCTAALDVYIMKDSHFQPLFKIEDNFLNFYSFNALNLHNWFFLPFDSVIRKAGNYDIESAIANRKKISAAEIDSFYTKKITTSPAGNTLQKGIYLTFEDFRQNKIHTDQFEIKKGALTDEVYVTSSGSPVLLTEYWGLSDGQQLFIKSGYNIFPVVRQQNSFEVYGSKYITHTELAFRNAVTGVVWGIGGKVLNKKILQLNMETGKFY